MTSGLLACRVGASCGRNDVESARPGPSGSGCADSSRSRRQDEPTRPRQAWRVFCGRACSASIAMPRWRPTSMVAGGELRRHRQDGQLDLGVGQVAAYVATGDDLDDAAARVDEHQHAPGRDHETVVEPGRPGTGVVALDGTDVDGELEAAGLLGETDRLVEGQPVGLGQRVTSGHLRHPPGSPSPSARGELGDALAGSADPLRLAAPSSPAAASRRGPSRAGRPRARSARRAAPGSPRNSARACRASSVSCSV